MQEWRERGSTAVGRRSSSPENTPLRPAELKERRGVEKNDKTTFEMEGQLKVTKKNQSFLPLTAVQVGNRIAGAEKGKSRRSLMGQRRSSKFLEREEEEVRNQH